MQNGSAGEPATAQSARYQRVPVGYAARLVASNAVFCDAESCDEKRSDGGGGGLNSTSASGYYGLGPVKPDHAMLQQPDYFQTNSKQHTPTVSVVPDCRDSHVAYARSFLGIVRIVRIVCHTIGLICVLSTSIAVAHAVGYLWVRYVYEAFSVYGIIVAALTFAIFYFNLQERGILAKVNWITIDALYCLEMLVIFFILSTACCLWERQLTSNIFLRSDKQLRPNRGGPGCAAFMGFMAAGSYLLEMIWKYLAITRD